EPVDAVLVRSGGPGTLGRREVHVVVEELAPGVAEVGQAVLIDGVDVRGAEQHGRLVADVVADKAGTGDKGRGAVGQRGRGEPVTAVGDRLVGGGGEAE